MSDLSAREVARLLGVPEKTVYRWVRRGEVPHFRRHDEIRFNAVELQEWAQSRGKALSPEVFPPATGEGQGGLAAALARGGIARELPGATREEVLAAVTALPGVPAGVDRKLLLELLLSRERLGSTGLGEGIAIPHPRDPLVLGAREPTVLLAFLAEPVDFQAADGQPVTTVFAILSPTVQAHLGTLSTLAYALHDPDLRRLLAARGPDADLLARVRALEATAAPRPPDHDPEEDEP